ncbi:TPA: hypothetical protein ACWXMG_005023 [Escherichia coli]|nr:hypothetical protein [Escherichia coli]
MKISNNIFITLCALLSSSSVHSAIYKIQKEKGLYIETKSMAYIVDYNRVYHNTNNNEHLSNVSMAAKLIKGQSEIRLCILNEQSCSLRSFHSVASIPSVIDWYNSENNLSLNKCTIISGTKPSINSFKFKVGSNNWINLENPSSQEEVYLVIDGVFQDIQFSYRYTYDPDFTVECPIDNDTLWFNTIDSSTGGQVTVFNRNTKETKTYYNFGYDANFILVRQGEKAAIDISPKSLTCKGSVNNRIFCGETNINTSYTPSKLSVKTATNLSENLNIYVNDGVSEKKITNGNSTLLSTESKKLNISVDSTQPYQGNISLNITATWD